MSEAMKTWAGRTVHDDGDHHASDQGEDIMDKEDKAYSNDEYDREDSFM
jgi:hypothetical protein